MIKGLSIIALVAMLTNVAVADNSFPWPWPGNGNGHGNVDFLRGQLDENVTVSFEDAQMKPRSYKGKCHGTIHYATKDVTMTFRLSSYNCQDGM